MVNYTQLFFWIKRHDPSIHTVYALGVQQLYTAFIPLLETFQKPNGKCPLHKKSKERLLLNDKNGHVVQ